MDNSSTQTGGGLGIGTGPDRNVLFQEPSPAFLLVIHGHSSFREQGSLPLAAWAVALLLRSPTPRNFTPLCLCSCCPLSQMPSPLSLSFHHLILQGPARMPYFLRVASPEPPAPALLLPPCSPSPAPVPPSAFVAESALG